jgi:pimeloyl-ACP methyl ester carboxylesterase
MLCLLVAALLVSSCTTGPTPTSTPEPTAVQVDRPRFETTDCWFEEPSGQDVECGYLTVPEDRRQPQGKTIQLAVARFKSDSANPEPDPIVYLEGGPGGSPLRSLRGQFNALLAPLLDKRDLILLDQRGTGYSQPALDCPEYKEWAISVLDQDLSVEAAEAQGNAALLECRERLIGEGVNPDAYTSAENAADLNDLRLALGIDEWNLYGISYGTRLALTAVRDFPEGLRSVVIDSVVPLQSNLFTELPASGARAFDVLFAACAADADCDAGFPDLRTVFFDLVDELNASPVTFPMKLKSGEAVTVLFDGDGLLGTIFQSLYATSLIPLLPRLIYEVRDGNYRLVSALQSAFMTQLDDISFGMHYSVQCGEEAPFGTPEELNAVYAQYPEYRGLGGLGTFDLCKAWDTSPAAAIENQPVASDIPTLVLAGEFDPITPPAWAELAAETLRNSYFYTLPHSGHGASLTGGECPRAIVLDFLDDPSRAPDTSCIASDMATLAFAPPVDDLRLTLDSFAEPTLGLRGVVPEGWKQLGPGTYTPTGSITDQTAIIQQAAPLPKDSLLRLLQTQLEQSGEEVTLEETGTRTAGELEWTLYTAEVSIASIDLALTEAGGITYFVVMQSVVDERDALYDALFLPAVDALQPLEQ